MQTSIKIQGRIFIAEQITHAVQYPDQILVYPVDYRMVSISGDDAKRMGEVLRRAGFVGEGTLVNPARLSVMEDAGTILKLTLEGADRLIMVGREYEGILFPALESQSGDAAIPKKRAKRSDA
jgi:hypothetical protein